MLSCMMLDLDEGVTDNESSLTMLTIANVFPKYLARKEASTQSELSAVFPVVHSIH